MLFFTYNSLFPKQSLLWGFWRCIFCIRYLMIGYFRPSDINSCVQAW